jgi:hypothetical protein
MGDAVRWAHPAMTTLWSQVWDEDGEKQPLQPQEFIDAFRSISTVNNSVKAYMAYYYQSYYTRDGRKTVDASETDAVATALFGLTPSSLETMYAQMGELKEDKAATQALKTQFMTSMRNALRAENEKDRQVWLRKARIYLQSSGVNMKEAGSWYAEAGRGNEHLFLDIDAKYRELKMKDSLRK